MSSTLAYHRPTDLPEALGLLSKPNHQPLGGGTSLVPEARAGDGVELVDLQALGLQTVEVGDVSANLGAMARLGDLASNVQLPGLISRAAKSELPSALRNQATVGGTIGQGDADSRLLAALLVHEAALTLGDGSTVSLDDYLTSDRDDLITSVRIATEGEGTIAATGRTPADDPIVAAVARQGANGPIIALTGVADHSTLTSAAEVSPNGDFQGTAEYRKHLAMTLSARVSKELAR